MASQRPPNDEPSPQVGERFRPQRNGNGNSNSKPPATPYQPFSSSAPPRQGRATPPQPPRPGDFFNPSNPNQPPARQRPPRSPGPPRPRREQARRNLPRLPLKMIFGYGFLIALVVGGLLALFVATRVFNFLNGITVARTDTSGNVITGSNVTGHGRVNIVLLGLDRRPNDNEGTRSDSMLLLSVDQDSKTANMLSIPRDLWIKIPGHGNNRVNAAYFFGDQDHPGTGGPPLVKQAIQENFGIRVDYFVEIDFNGFRTIIDAIGGITLDVKKPLVDSEYPTEDYGIKRIFIPAGIQHMDGQTALEYARSRHSDSDLGRNQRQQDVLLAVREQGINLGLLTNSKLQTALQGAIKTDLTPGDMFSLGQLAVGMKRDAIRQFSIDANITHNAFIDGNDVLVADPNSLNQILRDFQASAPASNHETAKINILNGTFTAGLAARTQKYLEGKGLAINTIDQAPNAGKYPQTIINVYTGKQQAASELAGLLGVSADHIKTATGGPAGVDIEVICGEDLNLPN